MDVVKDDIKVGVTEEDARGRVRWSRWFAVATPKGSSQKKKRKVILFTLPTKVEEIVDNLQLQ